MAEWTKATVLKTVVLRTPVNGWLGPKKEAPSFEVASLVSETLPSGRHQGGVLVTVGDVLTGRFPSCNSVVMTETILDHTSSLNPLLERLPPELHLTQGKQ